MAIISQGRLVANGSISELRAGVASTLPGSGQEQRLTLEEIFLSIVGASGQLEPQLGLMARMNEPNLGRAGLNGPLGASEIKAGGVFGARASAQYAAMAGLRWASSSMDCVPSWELLSSAHAPWPM